MAIRPPRLMMMKFTRVSAVAVRRVNHGQAYRADEGTTTTWQNRISPASAVSTSARSTRRLRSTSTTTPMAYREDTRRWSNGDIFRDILGKCARALVSRDGYWQGNHRLEESLAV
jgi:hypothetical protein